jgi:putative ABC transport system permease protein
MLNSSMIWVLLGLVAGSAGLARLLAGLLYNVRPLDPVVLGAVSLLLAAVALLASYSPARAAAKIDPMVALRWE